MFSYFVFSCFSQTPVAINFDIVPPIKFTAPGDYNFWTLTGSANNMKNSIHLGSKINKSNGIVCTRIPTSALEWNAKLNLSLNLGSFDLMYTLNVCPYNEYTNEMYWRGFSLHFSEVDGEKLDAEVITVKNDYSYSHTKLCQIPTTNPILYVQVKNQSVFLSYEDENGSKTPCSDSLKYFPYVGAGFFTFISQPTKKVGSADVYEFILGQPEGHKEEYEIETLEKISRKIITPKNRTFKHNQPTLAQRIHYASPEDSDPRNTLKYINAILAEMNNSLTTAMNAKELDALIETKIRNNLALIEKKITKRRDMLLGISNQLAIVKRNMSNDLNSLKNHVYVTMNAVSGSSVQELKKFLEKAKEANETLPKAAKESARTVKTMWVPTMLYVIAFIELACYIAFFFHKKKVTDNFKKYD